MLKNSYETTSTIACAVMALVFETFFLAWMGVIFSKPWIDVLICTKYCVKCAIRTAVETVTCSDIFGWDCSSLCNIFSDETDKLCDEMITTGLECNGIGLWSLRILSVCNGLWLTFLRADLRVHFRYCRTVLECSVIRCVHKVESSLWLITIYLFADRTDGASWRFMRLFHCGSTKAALNRFSRALESIKKSIPYMIVVYASTVILILYVLLKNSTKSW